MPVRKLIFSMVIELFIDTNYRSLIEGISIGISIGISLCGTHNIIICSNIDDIFREPESIEDLSGIMTDGKGVSIKKVVNQNLVGV